MRFILPLLLLPTLASRSANAETLVLRGAVQGTTYHIKFVESATSVDLQRLKTDVERLLGDIDRQMSTYRPDSEISRFNRATAGEWFTVSPAVVRVVNAARAISEKSDGAMDVTVGPLVRLWHFGPRKDKAPSPYPLPNGEGVDRRKFEPPSEGKIREARKRVGYEQLAVRDKPPALKKQVADLEVDLSSIASGWTIDRLAELLLDRGIKNFMVELGGEVRARGMREDGTPWRIAVERPLVGKHEMELAVPLVNAALATAGGTQKFFEYDGKRYSHIIDPATGRPVKHSLSSVTVAADTCLEADGWDTPLLVLGPQRGVEVAERNGIAAMFVVRPETGDGDEIVMMTAEWRKRFGDR